MSYTRFDDQRDRGKISQFRQELADEVRAVTGEPFEIFQDVEGIGLGEHWPDKLDEILDQARFFIPIMTPSYFNSEACRDELQKFLKAEEKSGRKDLILPIYYIQCRVLEDKELRECDSLAQVISERERSDWQELRHYSFRNRKVRLALEGLAREIDRARRRVVPRTAAAARPQNSARVDEPAPQRQPPQPPQNLHTAVREVLELTKRRVETRRRAEEAAPLQEAQAGIMMEPGTVFRDIDAPWCPELVVIPPGEFMMGSTEAERQWVVVQGTLGKQKVLGLRESLECEKPQHRVRIAYSLLVGRYPVTFEEYDHFAQAARREPPQDRGWGRARRPVIFVSWNDAKAYVEWLAAETGQPYRLLSEAEWEYACRAGTRTRYGWGDQISPENANYGAKGGESRQLGGHAADPLGVSVFSRKAGETSVVGLHAANRWGLYDMHGNVWEWCADRWHDSYDGAPDDGSAWVVGSHSRRVLRGGSWLGDPWELRSASRTGFGPENRNHFVGFRVARSLAGS